MSDGGGDGGGGGGDGGGAGKGGSGDSGGGGGDMANYSYTPSSVASDPTGSAGGYDPTSAFTSTSGSGGSVDDFVNDPAGGHNLTDPGPVSGGTGLPGAGGGTNTPFAFDNSDYLSGLDQYGGQPGSTGGATNTPFSFESGLASGLGVGESSAAPAGVSASSLAAPSGVAGNPDASSSTDLSSMAKKGTGSGGSAGGASQGSNILSSLGMGGGNIGSAAVGAAGLLNNLITGNKPLSSVAPLNANAATASAAGNQQISSGQDLQKWLTTGHLPDAYEQQVQKAAQDAKTRAISNAASQGLPTDPTQNTALAQQLNAIDAAIPGQREAIAGQLAQSGQSMVNAGLQATGVSSNVYQTLANLEDSKNKQTGQAISNFASALNGGGNKGLTLKVA